jgi:DNA-binding response OmpR family regulator
MPGGDGLNLLREIRGEGNSIPVIILSAYGEAETHLEALNAGALEYLNKPIDAKDLMAVVRRCLK